MYQIVEQTDEEKTEMYMKLDKKELVRMIISCNNVIDNLVKRIRKTNI